MTYRVFISSTGEDLQGPHRDAARKAVDQADVFKAVMMEDFVASGQAPHPLCMEKVQTCDVLVVIVARRYGWVPNGQQKSITWLECEQAEKQGCEVLAILLDKDANWPLELEEEYRATKALKSRNLTPELMAEIQRDVDGLKAFKKWLNEKTRRTFHDAKDIRAEVGAALSDWLRRKQPGQKAIEPSMACDPTIYLKWLREQTSTIDIRGFGVGSGKVHHFPIEELYIPLTTASGMGREPMDLRQALEHSRLVIVGDPGSGKSTFLRRITHQMAGGEKFPMLIEVDDLIEFMERCPTYAGPHAAQWLPLYMKAKSDEMSWGLSEAFFQQQLTGGTGLVLLDGLDEAPDPARRERVARLVENATGVYKKCQFVVTTRPKAYQGLALLQHFHEVTIDPLEPAAIETFLDHWCQALYPETGQLARDHRKELGDALQHVPEIRRMARNPVMLTALAVVHYNQAHLPEQRSELYECILKWLARARRDRQGREKPERCLVLLRQLALKMQDHPNGRRRSVGIGWAAEQLAPEMDKAKAMEFLEEETTDSGIIVSRGGEVEFWHLTFQEYLAAVAINALREVDQFQLLLGKEGKIFRSEWREVTLLLAGVLGKQGADKVDGLVSEILQNTEEELPKQARAAGLIGSMVLDLAPIGYLPKDPRYASLLEKVKAIFEKGKTRHIDVETRVAAAEAFDQANQSRLRTPNDVDYWVKVPGGNFSIGRFPVTVWEYRKYLDAKPEAKQPDNWDDQLLHLSQPVTDVSWHDAQRYCKWADCKLPTEEQWKLAAYGDKSREYPWGKESPDVHRANFNRSGKGPTPVGMFPDGNTPEEASDMAGNVWEWTLISEGATKIVRGASYGLDATGLRAADRNWYEPGHSGDYLGFRCLRDKFP